jgi:ubiquinone/menaquinone biosynthesis C-methylase UbiE
MEGSKCIRRNGKKMAGSSNKGLVSILGLDRLAAWLRVISQVTRINDAVAHQSTRLDQIDALFEELKQHVWESFRQIADVNQKSEEKHSEALLQLTTLTQRQDVDSGKILGLKREVMFQQRRLSRLGEELSTGDSVKIQKIAANLYDERIDSLYVAFEDVFRGTRTDIKSRLAPYIEHVMLAGAGSPGKPILDIGCGRGEWLELLGEHHLECYGVDLNSMMVDRCKSLGFSVSKADAIDHLRGLPDQSLSAITAFHFIEHIPFDAFITFLDEALRVLTQGGILILETPNPETIRVGATTFYYDPTHRNPLPPIPTQFIVEHRGFSSVEILRLHPIMDEKLKGDDENSNLLNRVIFGPQDYAIIARRDGQITENIYSDKIITAAAETPHQSE